MTTLTRTLIATLTALGLAVGLAGPSSAADYQKLNGADLQQTVLRAQMPQTLGTWTQNYYFTLTEAQNTRPTLCWNSAGEVRLPSASILGGVGYAVSNTTNGGVSVYQYGSAAEAEAALAALRKADCADNPTVMTDEGKKVQGQSGSDFTDASTTGYGVGLSYPQGDVIVFESLLTTQRGLAVVQTQILRTVPKSTSLAKQIKVANRLGAVNKRWHRNAVRAYESFGQGNAR